MDVVAFAKYIGALLAAVGGPAVVIRVAQSAFPDQKERLRAVIERNADLLSKFPETSDAHKILLQSIENDLKRLTTDLDEARRDPMSIGLGIAFVVMALAAGEWALQLDGWWQIPLWLVTATLGLFGIVGITQGVRHTRRDEKGNPVK